MIKNETTRDELKRISSELYAMGQRIRALSVTISREESQTDGNEIFNVGSYVGSQIAAIAQTAGFSITIDGDKMSFEDWNDEQ